jgi:pimeloyl-ACP methyl ester carboxylesterase
MNSFKIRICICIIVILSILPACNQPFSGKSSGKINLQPCTGYWHYTKVLCGTLRVYEDRAAQRGRMIGLKVVVIKATSEHPAPDAIFYLAGGPGGAAASEDAKYQQFSTSLSENHDLVFVDQRGTGESNQVMVPTDPPDFSGMTPEQIDAAAKKWVADYLAEIDMDPRFYTTSVAMDDLDEVRQALGYDQINLFGYSYGATAAQYYLRQHEDHVRTVTLGGGSLLDIPVFERWAQNTQQALDGVFDLCMAKASCQAAFPNLRTEFSGLMSRLAAEPKAVLYTNPADGQSGTITFDVGFFSGTLRNMMKDATNDPMLPLNIHRAAVDDNWQGFVNFILGGGGPEWWGDQIMDHVIRCTEKWAAFDPAVVAKLSQDSFMSVRDTTLAQNQAFSCLYTPAGITLEGQDLQPVSRVPVFIFNGSLDPIDPPANMDGASQVFPNSLSLTLPYQAHSQSNLSVILCYFGIQNDFIQSGSTEALDTTCMKNVQPPVFVTP